MNNAHISIHSAARYLFSWLLVILLLITALPVVAQGPEQTGEPPGRTTEQGAEPTSPPVPVLQEAPKRLKGLEEPLPPRTGFVPPPMDLSHLKGQRLLGQYVSAPASWDWRTSAVTPVKDQGACGSCYAFASIGNIESKLLIDSAGTWDFSENNAKECNWYETSGGGTSCSGGDYWQLASLFSKKGTVLESCDPYVASDVVSCNATCPYQKTLLVWRVISGETMPDTEVLKTYIQTYGPVYTSMYAGYYDAWDTEFSDYDGSYTLYYTGAEDPNHAVLIVGWDDSLTHAGGTGGWIAKNSWGTSWGGTCGYGTEGGYFTIAYGSASIGKYSSFMYDWQDYDTSGEIMYYDEGGWSTSWGCTGSTTAWGLVRFTPTSNTSVTRVEFWTADATTDVDVYIYDDFDGTAPSNLLAQKLNNSFNEAGYHSVALDTPLPTTSGDDVVAVVKFTNDSSTLPTYPVVADAVGPSETGRTYFSCDGSAPWDDMGDSESDDVAIRLRTSAGGGGVGPVVYDSHTVDDDNSDESSGNDDGIVNPDETIELDVDLRNQGSDTATGVNATISTSDSYVTFLFNTSSSYGDIPGGGTGTNGDDFDFDVDPSTPDGHVICFDLDITSSNGGPWSDSFCVTVGGGAKTYLPIVLKNHIPGQLYFDDFSDPNSGWGVGDYSDYAHGYDSGNYYIQLKRDYWSAWAWPGFACADCTIEVEAWRCSGANSGYGIVFGLNSSGDQFYSFEVQPGNREYRLRRYDEGTWVTLISFTYSSYISSYNSHNRLKATREGSQIKLYVNGYYLTSYTDSTYTGSRYVGVHGRSGATSPVWLRYDDFTVWGSGYGTTSATEVGSGGVGMAPAPPD